MMAGLGMWLAATAMLLAVVGMPLVHPWMHPSELLGANSSALPVDQAGAVSLAATHSCAVCDFLSAFHSPLAWTAPQIAGLAPACVERPIVSREHPGSCISIPLGLRAPPQ